MRHIVPVVALTLGLLAGSALAESPTSRELEARQIERDLVAPCCWRQQVAVHDSPAAQEIKQDIRARLERGEDRAAILEAYTTKYGSAVLVEPPARGFTWALYVLPPVVLVLSGVALVAFVRRFSRPADASPDAAVPDASHTRAYDRRLDDDLDAMD